jgi:hypothetical protein
LGSGRALSWCHRRRSETRANAKQLLIADRAQAFSRWSMLATRRLMRAVGDYTILQPVCPACGMTLRLSRITPGTDSLSDRYTYSCQPCGLWVTEAADARVTGRG